MTFLGTMWWWWWWQAGRRLADRSRITKRRHPSWADTKSDYKIKNPSNPPPPPSLHSLTPHPIFQSDKCHFCCCSILNFFITRFLIPPRQRTSGNNSDNQLIIPAIQSFSRLLVVEWHEILSQIRIIRSIHTKDKRRCKGVIFQVEVFFPDSRSSFVSIIPVDSFDGTLFRCRQKNSTLNTEATCNMGN